MDMDIDVRRDGDSLIISSAEQHHTLMTALRQAAWDVDGTAGYNRGHPFQGDAELVVTGEDAEETVMDAVEKVRDDIAAFRDAFESA